MSLFVSSVSSSSSSSRAEARPMEASNDAVSLYHTFPELADANVCVVTMPFANIEQMHPVNSRLTDILDATGMENAKRLKEYLNQRGIKNPRILSIIDLQGDFLDNGSLEVKGAQSKVMPAIRKYLEENEKRIKAGQKPLFDLIIVTKDFHPDNHLSFTKMFYDVQEGIINGKKGFKLTPNERGRALGVEIRQWWSILHPEFTCSVEGDSYCLVPNAERDFDKLKRAVFNGRLLPFSQGLHPIAVTDHMFRKVEGIPQKKVFDDLKAIHLLDERNRIVSDFEAGGVKLNEAFSIPPKFPAETVFDERFVKGLALKLNQPEAKTRMILQGLLEDFWPNHCVQGDEGHLFHPALVEAISAYASKIPVVALPKGMGPSESYSGAVNTAGALATPYLPLLDFLEPEENTVCGTATGYCPSGTAADSRKAGHKTTYWTGGSKGITPEAEEYTHAELAALNIKVVEDLMNPAASSSSSSSSGSALLNAYFRNVNQINSQSDAPEFGANILLGPKTPGYADKIPLPFSLSSFGFDHCKSKIKVQEDMRWKMTAYGADMKDNYPSLKYDIDNSLVREFGLDFDAFLSEKGQISLPEEAAKKAGIDPLARTYAFVYPANAMGSAGFLEMARNKGKTPKAYFDEIAAQLNRKFGPDFASLIIIGGYAYFNEAGTLIQVKPIVTKATDDVLSIGKAISSSTAAFPKEIREEFEKSVALLRDNQIRDGLCNPITAPELLEYGATHFAYIPNGYYPEALKEQSGSNVRQRKQICDDFWKTYPFGLFLYHFQNPAHNCYLPIVAGEQAPLPEGKVGATIVVDGVRTEIETSVEKDCLLCYDAKPNVVYQLNDIEKRNPHGGIIRKKNFVAVCCSDCNATLTAVARNSLAYNSNVLAFYEVEIKPQAVKNDFYDILNVKPVRNYQEVRVNEMALSQTYPVTLTDKKGANIPEAATHFAFLYPAQKLKSTTRDDQISSIYEMGGFAYYQNERLVGVNHFTPRSPETKAIGFDDLKEVELDASTREEFRNLIAQNKIPLVTIKKLRSKGVRHFMWVHPKDARFPSPFGQFLYFNADASKVFAKVVNATKASGSEAF